MDSAAIIAAVDMWSGLIAAVAGACIAIRVADWALGQIRSMTHDVTDVSDEAF